VCSPAGRTSASILTLRTTNGPISGRSETAGFGADADRPATVVRFTADDLARVRFAAAPAPLVETALGFAELRHHARRPVPDGWASRARHAFPAAARPLRDLIPASGPWPEFLDLARALADGDREALTTAVQALRAFYLACVAPAWPEIAASFRGDVTERAGVLASRGLGDLFGSLHPDLALRDGSLERSGRALVRAGRPAEFRLEGQGLQILPSMLWTGPPLFSINPPGPLPSVMIYPGRRDSRPGHGTRPADLDAVLGRTRASVLRALRDTCSTIELAARVSISVSSASEHATALRAADLIRTERHGPRVRHSLTVLGRALLNGSPSRGAVPLRPRR
jgi:DNA-binding transcriptional ArsR family regulator